MEFCCFEFQNFFHSFKIFQNAPSDIDLAATSGTPDYSSQASRWYLVNTQQPQMSETTTQQLHSIILVEYGSLLWIAINFHKLWFFVVDSHQFPWTTWYISGIWYHLITAQNASYVCQYVPLRWDHPRNTLAWGAGLHGWSMFCFPVSISAEKKSHDFFLSWDGRNQQKHNNTNKMTTSIEISLLPHIQGACASFLMASLCISCNLNSISAYWAVYQDLWQERSFWVDW